MPKFSRRSRRIINSCHPDIKLIMNEVIKHFDITALEGYRPQEKQNSLYEKDRTQVKYPNSMHNKIPSLAIDIAPYDKNVKGGVDWSDRDRFHLMAGFVLATAIQLNINLRWGGDWNRDTHTKDNDFDDLVHFELVL